MTMQDLVYEPSAMYSSFASASPPKGRDLAKEDG